MTSPRVPQSLSVQVPAIAGPAAAGLVSVAAVVAADRAAESRLNEVATELIRDLEARAQEGADQVRDAATAAGDHAQASVQQAGEEQRDAVAYAAAEAQQRIAEALAEAVAGLRQKHSSLVAELNRARLSLDQDLERLSSACERAQTLVAELEARSGDVRQQLSSRGSTLDDASSEAWARAPGGYPPGRWWGEGAEDEAGKEAHDDTDHSA